MDIWLDIWMDRQRQTDTQTDGQTERWDGWSCVVLEKSSVQIKRKENFQYFPCFLRVFLVFWIWLD